MIRPEDRQGMPPVKEMLEQKRLKELKNNETFRQFEMDLDLDSVISKKFEELDQDLDQIKDKFHGLNGNDL